MQAVVKTVASRDLTPKLSRRITRWSPAGRRPVWSVFDLLGGVGVHTGRLVLSNLAKSVASLCREIEKENGSEIELDQA